MNSAVTIITGPGESQYFEFTSRPFSISHKNARLQANGYVNF